MRPDIVTTLLGLGQIYEKRITDELVQIWCNVLKEISPEELTTAVKAYVIDPKNVFMPKPGQIYGIARPQPDKEEEAALIVDRIFHALRSHGTDAYGTERAKDKIGEFGWNYILQVGGWHSFVGSVRSEDDVPIIKSQIRKSLMGLIQRQRNDIQLLQNESDSAKLLPLKSLGLEMKTLKPDVID